MGYVMWCGSRTASDKKFPSVRNTVLFFEAVTLAGKERNATLVSVASKEIPIPEVNMS